MLGAPETGPLVYLGDMPVAAQAQMLTRLMKHWVASTDPQEKLQVLGRLRKWGEPRNIKFSQDSRGLLRVDCPSSHERNRLPRAVAFSADLILVDGVLVKDRLGDGLVPAALSALERICSAQDFLV